MLLVRVRVLWAAASAPSNGLVMQELKDVKLELSSLEACQTTKDLRGAPKAKALRTL